MIFIKVIDYFKNIIEKIKNRNKNPLLLETSPNFYKDLINNPPIDTIITNMPSDLSEIEKAYYIYLELGKLLNESPEFVFSDRKGQEEHYNDVIKNDEYYGICKSISELYVSILSDKRIGITAELVKKKPESSIPHIDTILKINGKNYVVNLINDLSRIKTSRRINGFCIDLAESGNFPEEIKNDRKAYLERLEKYYGKIDSLTRKEVAELDKKFGYSFFVPQFSKNDDRGIYTEDVIELLKKDMENPESFKEHVLHNKDVPKEDILKYKLDYIFENIDKLTDYNGNMQYLENIRYYISIIKKLSSKEECLRMHAYVATVGENKSNIISILKLKPFNKTDDTSKNVYYLYSTDDKKYVNKSPEEVREFIDKLDKKSLKIIGTFDRYNPKEIDELEL